MRYRFHRLWLRSLRRLRCRAGRRLRRCGHLRCICRRRRGTCRRASLHGASANCQWQQRGQQGEAIAIGFHGPDLNSSRDMFKVSPPPHAQRRNTLDATGRRLDGMFEGDACPVLLQRSYGPNNGDNVRLDEKASKYMSVAFPVFVTLPSRTAPTELAPAVSVCDSVPFT
jgi:hypothetical protein